MRAASLSLQAKLSLTAVALGGTAAVAGLGTFGTFTSTTSTATGVTAGTVTIALGTAGTADNRLSIAATGLVPTDTVQRAVTLSNTGNQDLASLTLTTTASPSSLLDTDATNGLQIKVDRCSVAWTETGTSAPFTYTCSTGAVPVIASRPVIGSAVSLPSSPALTAGGNDRLVATLTLPSTASNTFQGLTSTINFTVVATQRAGTAK